MKKYIGIFNIFSEMAELTVFDSIKCEQFLSSLDEKARFYASKIIENTIYISTDQMVEMIKRSFCEFEKDFPKYNLFVPNDKIGSDHYILLQMKDVLNPVQIFYGKKEVRSLSNEFPIIMLDDAVYSSCHVCSHIDEIRFGSKLKNKFIVICAVLSSRNVDVLKDSYFNAEIYRDMILEHLLPKNLFSDYDEKSEYDDDDYLYNTFGCETGQILPLIFEHKIANAFGSYQFYHQIIKEPISRAKINKITKVDIENVISELKTKNKL